MPLWVNLLHEMYLFTRLSHKSFLVAIIVFVRHITFAAYFLSILVRIIGNFRYKNTICIFYIDCGIFLHDNKPLRSRYGYSSVRRPILYIYFFCLFSRFSFMTFHLENVSKQYFHWLDVESFFKIYSFLQMYIN